ncbi:CaiB/BaiF CoA transferase family protein [Ardenticatena maritima]|uniref:Alpha-methylacyl-CoA racemase n=2 Tax=Ardenticatena maritima TaxID=872965 RepID=A0A0P6XX92_9CHLR|nr:CaiB/BaiF CoA-transferase family protein [Ardenticatena maritima]KPL88316.1 hypothetical protein SE16_05665 [Ardenticatena maritima]
MLHQPPLHGYRVLDLAHLLPGELATMWLGDLGADVIKIEAPERHQGGLSMPRTRENPYRAALNRNKRSIALDLKTDAGRDIFYRLVETADVLVEGFRPGVMARLGADYATLRQRNPRLVYCSISGYGQTGPYRERPGHDNNYLALAGLLLQARPPNGAPHLLPVQLADVGGGAWPAVATILAALLARKRTGEGQHLDVSMLDGALAWAYFWLPLSKLPLLEEMGVGTGMLTGKAPCYNVYATADERFLALGALEPKFWRAFCETVERPDWLPRAFDPTLRDEIAALFATRPLDAWLNLFDPQNVPITPLLDMEEVQNDPHIQARESIYTDDNGFPHPRFPVRLSATPAGEPTPPPNVGEQTDAILRDIGLSDLDIARLRDEGVVA